MDGLTRTNALAALYSPSMTPGDDELAIVDSSAAEYGKETVSVGHELAAEYHETLGIFDKWIQECRV